MELKERELVLKEEELAEEPIVLLIIAEGGVLIFSYSFVKELSFEDEIFGSFLTAFNSFSDEFFSEVLDRAKFGPYSVLMERISNFTVCYLFKGQVYLAQQQLSQFIKQIQEDDSILQTLNKYYETSRIVEFKDIPLLKSLIIEIFIKSSLDSRIAKKGNRIDMEGVYTSDEIREKSVGLITIHNYKPRDQLKNEPIQYKLNDINSQLNDTTISELNLENYSKNFAHIDLALPIIHIEHTKSLLNMLNSICSNCGRILLTDEQLQNHISRHRRYINLFGKTNKAIYFNLLKAVKNITKCDCGANKRKITFVEPAFFYEEGRTCEENYGRPLYFYEVLLSRGKTKEAEKIASQLMVVDIRERIENLGPDICDLFGLNPTTVFLDALPIPFEYFQLLKDLKIEFQKNNKTVENITDIIKVNQFLHDKIDTFADENNKNDDPMIILLYDLWNLLQYCCSTFLNNEQTGLLSERVNYILKSIKSRQDILKILNLSK